MTETYIEEYWDIDGTSLHRNGWSVESLSALDVPTLRGDDAAYAYRPGNEYRDKADDSRIVSLSMWVTGTDPATGLTTADPKVLLQDNLRTLRRLVRKPEGGQVTVTRRQKFSTGLLTTTALAEITSMYPSMTGRTRAAIAMDLYLTVPYFFGSTVTTSSITVANSPVVINNPGDTIAGWFNFEFDLVGPLVNPEILIQAPGYGVWTKYTGTIGSGTTITFNNETFTCTDNLGNNVIDKVSHGGKRYWLGLYPGNNNATLTADSGAGSCVIRYKPAYF